MHMRFQRIAATLLLCSCFCFPSSAMALPEIEEETTMSFEDVCENAWYYDAVHYVKQHNIMIGTSDNTFEPEAFLTRAQVVMILYNESGKPEVTTEYSSFDDVKTTAWYFPAVQWAYENGYAAGTGNHKFCPNDNVTREEFAQFLYNYSGRPEIETGALEIFPDCSVVTWSETAMTWAKQQGYINGVLQGKLLLLAAKNTATRAQAAMIMKNYLAGEDNALPEQPNQPNAQDAYVLARSVSADDDSTAQYLYNAEGRLVQIVYCFPSLEGWVYSGYSEITYEDDRISSVTSYFANDAILNAYTYIYNENGNLYKVLGSNGDYIEYAYLTEEDAEEHLFLDVRVDGYGIPMLYHGRLDKVTEYRDGAYKGIYTYTYNGKGQIVREEYHFTDCAEIPYCNYKYDKNSCLSGYTGTMECSLSHKYVKPQDCAVKE